MEKVLSTESCPGCRMCIALPGTLREPVANHQKGKNVFSMRQQRQKSGRLLPPPPQVHDPPARPLLATHRKCADVTDSVHRGSRRVASGTRHVIGRRRLLEYRPSHLRTEETPRGQGQRYRITSRRLAPAAFTPGARSLTGQSERIVMRGFYTDDAASKF